MKIEIRKCFTGRPSRRAKMAAMLLFAVMLPVLLVMGITQADMVYAALNATETTETSLGTIQVPPTGVSRIVGVYGALLQPLATSGETVTGFFRIASGVTSGKFKFPAQGIAGAAAVGVIQEPLRIIPVNIPVVPNDILTIYMAANKAMTGTGEGVAGLIFE